MTLPVFGINFIRVDEESVPVIGADLSIIGLVGPAGGADSEFFPLDTPVKVYSNDIATLAKLGTAGYLLDAISGINDQLATMEQAAICVIVRTAEGDNPDPALRAEQTIAKVMGDSTTGTGIWALVQAPDLLAVTPRLICCPGYTGQLATTLDTLTIGVHGSGYVPGQSYPLTFTGGVNTGGTTIQGAAHALADVNGQINNSSLVIDHLGGFYDSAPTATIPAPPAAVQATLTAHLTGGAVDALIEGVVGSGYVPGQTYNFTFSGGGGGAVQATGHALANALGQIGQADYHIDSAGSGYTSAPTIALQAPPAAVQATVTATVAAGANPVCASLAPVLEQLVGHGIVESAGTSEQDDEDWRETLNSQRIITLSGGCKVLDPTTAEIVIRPFAPRFAGLLVRRDFATGAPFHSAANQPVYGIVGPARAIRFSIADGANEGQSLLGNNIGILVRGEVGSDFAISSGGFISIATDNCGDDPLWQMYNVTRGRDFIHLSLLRAMRVYLGRFNITGQAIRAILNTMGFFLSDLQAEENILGYKLEFRGQYNSADQIRLGHLTVGFMAEEPPVLKRITTRSARYRPAIDSMVAALEQQLSMAA